MVRRWVFANDAAAASNESDSGEEEEEEEEEDEEGMQGEAGEQASEDEQGSDGDDVKDTAGASAANEAGPSSSSKQAVPKKGKISMALGGLACHVCGKRGHNAGFVGSVYIDCPNKPCYLCKKPGHTTATCPYRLAPDHDCTPTARAGDFGMLAGILQRAHDSRRRELRLQVPDYNVDAAVLKLHARRCTCMHFHPSRDNLALSGDKKGQVAIWDHMKVYERTVWTPHEALTNNLAFLPSHDGMSCCSSSSDGTLKVIDLETGTDRTLLNVNPDGWIGQPSKWIMLYGLDVCQARQLIAVGDTRGSVHFLDARMDTKIASCPLHKTGNKVNSAHFSAADQDLLVTASNDWTARLCDIRRLASSTHSATDSKGKGVASAPLELARVEHPKVVNSAYFSPTSGRKLLTTCIDNRLRIWDYLLRLDGPADREIVHSHDFNRYLTPFRAEWDPKDPSERLVVVGRYISEDFGGVALHPIDLFDAGTGRLLSQLTDPNLMTITPVNKFHPRLDMILSGSSSSLYAWRPVTPGTDGLDGSTTPVPAAAAQGGAPQGSADFVFYDAGADNAEKKKRRATTAKLPQTEAGILPDKSKILPSKSKAKSGDAELTPAKKRAAKVSSKGQDEKSEKGSNKGKEDKQKKKK